MREELILREALRWRLIREACETDLGTFLKHAWPHFDPAPFMSNWHIEAIAEHLKAVSDGQIKRLLINIPPRTGKPVSQNSLIMCQEKGLVPLSEIAVDDHVWTHKGRWRRVLEVFEQGELETLRITTRTGRTLDAAPDHPVLTPAGWVNAGELQVDDVVGVVPGDGSGGSGSISVEEARLLGYLVGDGNMQGTPNVTSDDDAVTADIIRCAEALGFQAKETRYKLTGEGRHLRRVSIYAGLEALRRDASDRRKLGYRGPVKRWAARHSLEAKSSYTKMIPEAVMRGTCDVVTAFIGAYWSCDGWITTKGAKRDGVARDDLEFGISSVNGALIVQVQQLLTRLGIRSYTAKKTARVATKKQGDFYVSYSLIIQTQDNCWRFADLVRLEHRKYDRYLKARRRRFDFDRTIYGESVRSVEVAGQQACRCLTVEEDSSFVANGIAVHNTNLVSVAWPCWTWALHPDPAYPLHGPGVKFLCASYGAQKAEQDGVTARRLIGSGWFQELWGDRCVVAKDRDNQSQFDTIAGGSRINTGIPESLGKGGAVRIADDINKVNEVESDLVRGNIAKSYNEIWRTRSNDPTYGAEVIIMQRLHAQDISGVILDEEDPALVHLMLPMEFEVHRSCVTVLGFTDPRQADGELLWPERFDAAWAAKQKVQIGPVAWTGQFQQSPVMRGGSIIQRDWWRVWPPEGDELAWTRSFDVDGKTVRRLVFPDLDFVLVSADTAYTDKEENDFSACTTWGVFTDPAGNPKVILIEAWRERLELRGLVLKLLDTARRRKADMMLIEAKASGLSVAQEIRRLMRGEEFTLATDVPKGDKVARLHAVSAAFSGGLVYAPNRRFAEMVINETTEFPRSKWKDLTDSTSAAIKKLRDLGLLQHAQEAEAERSDAILFTGQQKTMREELGL